MGAGEKVNILLVDDQPGKLMTYEVMLRELGENLLVASSANEALQTLLRHDVVWCGRAEHKLPLLGFQ